MKSGGEKRKIPSPKKQPRKGLNCNLPNLRKEIPYAGKEIPAFRPFIGQRVEFLIYLIKNSNS
jgi:hypothetical protein